MTIHLDDMSNTFDEVHRVCCFNHTLQLSAKVLLKPFNAGMSSSREDQSDSDGDIDDIHFEEPEDEIGRAHV